MTPVSPGKGAGSQCVGNAVPRRSLRRVWGSTKHRFEPQRPRTGVEGQSACGQLGSGVGGEQKGMQALSCS